MVVHVLLVRPGGARVTEEIFLLRRAGTGFMDGFYVPPGGHLHAGESVAQAAGRECLEETGVTPARLEPLCVLPYRSGRHQGFNFVFAGGELPAQPHLAEPAASDQADWHPVDALPEPVAPWLDTALELRRRGDWFQELHWP